MVLDMIKTKSDLGINKIECENINNSVLYEPIINLLLEINNNSFAFHKNKEVYNKEKKVLEKAKKKVINTPVNKSNTELPVEVAKLLLKINESSFNNSFNQSIYSNNPDIIKPVIHVSNFKNDLPEEIIKLLLSLNEKIDGNITFQNDEQSVKVIQLKDINLKSSVEIPIKEFGSEPEQNTLVSELISDEEILSHLAEIDLVETFETPLETEQKSLISDEEILNQISEIDLVTTAETTDNTEQMELISDEEILTQLSEIDLGLNKDEVQLTETEAVIIGPIPGETIHARPEIISEDKPVFELEQTDGVFTNISSTKEYTKEEKNSISKQFTIDEEGIFLGISIGSSTKDDVISIMNVYTDGNFKIDKKESMFYFKNISLNIYFDELNIVRELEFGHYFKGATKGGLSIGDTVEKAIEIYGKPKMKTTKGAIWDNIKVFYHDNIINIIKLQKKA
jgi:hypothetical protein